MTCGEGCCRTSLNSHKLIDWIRVHAQSNMGSDIKAGIKIGAEYTLILQHDNLLVEKALHPHNYLVKIIKLIYETLCYILALHQINYYSLGY